MWWISSVHVKPVWRNTLMMSTIQIFKCSVYSVYSSFWYSRYSRKDDFKIQSRKEILCISAHVVIGVVVVGALVIVGAKQFCIEFSASVKIYPQKITPWKLFPRKLPPMKIAPYENTHLWKSFTLENCPQEKCPRWKFPSPNCLPSKNEKIIN